MILILPQKKSTNSYAVKWSEQVLERKADAFYRRHGRVPSSDGVPALNGPQSSYNGSSDSEQSNHSVSHPNLHYSATTTTSSTNESIGIESDSESKCKSNNSKSKATYPIKRNLHVSDEQRADSQKEYHQLKAMKDQLKAMQQKTAEMNMQYEYQLKAMQQQNLLQQQQMMAQFHTMQQYHQQQLQALQLQRQMADDVKPEMYFPSLKCNSQLQHYAQIPLQPQYDDMQPINQPEFLPQPPLPRRYSRGSSLSQEIGTKCFPMPPPLKTEVGKGRRNSITNMLSMYQQQDGTRAEAFYQNDSQSTHCGHSVHSGSARTTVSGTTVPGSLPRQGSRGSQPCSQPSSTPATPRTVASDGSSRLPYHFPNPRAPLRMTDPRHKRNPFSQAVYGASFTCGPQMMHHGQMSQMPYAQRPMMMPMGAAVPPHMMYPEQQRAANVSSFYGQNLYNLQNGHHHHQQTLDRLKKESEMASPPTTAVEAPVQQPVGTNLSTVAPHVSQESSALGSVKVTPPHSNMSSMQLDSYPEFGLPSNNNSPDGVGVDIIPFDQEVPFMRETDPYSPTNLLGSPNLLSGPNMMSVSNSGMNCGIGMMDSVTNMSMSMSGGNGIDL